MNDVSRVPEMSSISNLWRFEVTMSCFIRNVPRVVNCFLFQMASKAATDSSVKGVGYPDLKKESKVIPINKLLPSFGMLTFSALLTETNRFRACAATKRIIALRAIATDYDLECEGNANKTWS